MDVMIQIRTLHQPVLGFCQVDWCSTWSQAVDGSQRPSSSKRSGTWAEAICGIYSQRRWRRLTSPVAKITAETVLA